MSERHTAFPHSPDPTSQTGGGSNAYTIEGLSDSLLEVGELLGKPQSVYVLEHTAWWCAAPWPAHTPLAPKEHSLHSLTPRAQTPTFTIALVFLFFLVLSVSFELVCTCVELEKGERGGFPGSAPGVWSQPRVGRSLPSMELLTARA